MNRENCIFNSKKQCSNCGECERCDLNSNKTCNNCGKCLELEGYDMKAIKIDEIIDDAKYSKEFEQELEKGKKDLTSHENHYQLQKDDLEDDLEDDLTKVSYDNEQDIENSYDDYESESNNDDVEYDDEMGENVVYIDDIEGLSELLEEDKVSELFPGVLRYDGKVD